MCSQGGDLEKAQVMICLAMRMILRGSFRHLHVEPDFGYLKGHIQSLQVPSL